MTLFDPPTDPPKEEPGDGEGLYRVAEAAVSLIPGGAALLNHILQRPLERRLHEWRQGVGEKLRELEQSKGVDVEGLGADPQFIDAVLAATQVALRTSQTEKLKALRNAVLNAALPTRPDETLQQLFIEMVDRFTPWHLRLLKMFHDPAGYMGRVGRTYKPAISASLGALIETVFPELAGRRELYDRLWADVHAAMLTDTPSLSGMMTPEGATQKRTNALGDKFLAFIEAPM